MSQLLLFLHIVGVVFWAGGVFVINLVLTPSMRAISPSERGKLMGAFVKRFAPLAWGTLAVAGVTGLIMANGIVGLSSLFSFNTRYGNMLLVKIVVVIAILANGIYLSFVLGPKIAQPAAGGPKPGAPGAAAGPPGPPPQVAQAQRMMATLSWVQVVLALVVIFLAVL